MSSKTLPGEVANLLQGVRTHGPNSPQFTQLVECFQPTLTKIASKYDSFWLDDYVQEGTLGLLNAAQKFPASADPTKFIYYATTAIQSRMNNFYLSAVERQPQVSGLGSIKLEENEIEDALMQIPAPIDYVTSTTLAIDFKYHFNTESLSRNGFSENEILVFNLHFFKGLAGNEIAEQIKLSEGQVSKLIKSARIKAQRLFIEPQKSKLN